MVSPVGDLVAIVNPHAGRGRVGEGLPELERSLIARGLRYRIVETSGPGDAVRLAREAIDGGTRYLVAVGGDGTVHEVVNGMFASGRERAEGAVLGVVAAGSGCDLVRTFGLPGDATRAGGHLAGENAYPLDVGHIRYSTADGQHERYFVNVAEAGLGGAVALRAERLPRSLGQSRYFLGFWLTLPRYRLAQVRVVAGRQVYEGPAYAIILGNAQFYGGGMRISPRSYPGDGVLDVLIFKGPKSDAFTLLPQIYRGGHLPHDHIEEFRVRDEVTIEADRPLPIEADGEFLGTTPATVSVLAHPILMKL
ncbi:MAG: diacylglycerol/lipid kinase family protein [Actinomycetota bacterium]